MYKTRKNIQHTDDTTQTHAHVKPSSCCVRTEEREGVEGVCGLLGGGCGSDGLGREADARKRIERALDRVARDALHVVERLGHAQRAALRQGKATGQGPTQDRKHTHVDTNTQRSFCYVDQRGEGKATEIVAARMRAGRSRMRYEAKN